MVTPEEEKSKQENPDMESGNRLKNKQPTLDALAVYLNVTISLGVQSKILHNLFSVNIVIFLPFFKLSKVRLSIPDFKSLY